VVEIATRLTASAMPEANDANEMTPNFARSEGEVMARKASLFVTTGTLAVRSGLGAEQCGGYTILTSALNLTSSKP
jgi:hypothetical protein